MTKTACDICGEEISTVKSVISKMQGLIEGQSKQIQIQEKIIENYRETVDNYERKVEILEELLRRAENEAMAQGSDQLSSSAAVDSSVEGVVSDSGTSSEGSHT